MVNQPTPNNHGGVSNPAMKERLPPLRKDLVITKGAAFWTGAPSFLLHDPVQNKYFRLGAQDLEFLSIWKSGTMDELVEEFSLFFERFVGEEEVMVLAKFLLANSLLEQSEANAWKQFEEQFNASKQALWKRGVHSYLFFRIPLFDPQRLLTWVWPCVSFLFTRTTAVALFLLGLISLYFASQQWGVFKTTFMDFLTLDGFIIYGVSLVFIKAIHELGHAFMAHKYNIRVPTIGVAFIVLMPILYTDTTGAHSLLSRRKKLNIDLAGIYAELALASMATMLWVFLPDGPMRSVAFATATLSWVMSLAVNLNPFMRFDGYYILSDLTGFENLQDRGFALAKWRLRQLLFQLNTPSPESLPKGWILPIVLHAWGTWIYRFFLFLGIALLVYGFFIKIVGIALFVIEIAWFILLPIAKELKHWWEIRHMIIKSKRSMVTIGFLLVGLLILFLPWENRAVLPAVLKIADTTKLYPPKAAQLVSLKLASGEPVRQGQILGVLASPELTEESQRLDQEIKLLKARLARSPDNVEDHSLRLVLQNELVARQTELDGLNAQIRRLTITAPVDGKIVDNDPALSVGMWINPSSPLATIKPFDTGTVVAYGDEVSVMRVSVAAKGVFVPLNQQLQIVKVSLRQKPLISAPILHDEILADIYGGSISVSMNQDSNLGKTVLKPHQSYFKLELAIDEHLPPDFLDQIIPGVVHLEAERKSYAARIGERIVSVLIRELGL